MLMAAIITYTHFDNVARRVGADAGHRIATRATVATAVDASGTAPRRTGNLARSQRFRIRRVGLNTVGTVWYPLDYAASVHEGARRHTIRPRHAGGWLRFVQNGRIRYAREVSHPGQRANPWLFRSLAFEAGRLDFRVMPR